MNWTTVLEKYGVRAEQAGAAVDPFHVLAANAGTPSAKITYTLGTSAEYGAVKCSVTVTIAAPQTEAGVNMAAEVAFLKAVELLNDGASHLELPGVPVPR